MDKVERAQIRLLLEHLGAELREKPLATHWDQMWASIAVQLWNGELEPKSQADISRAMLNWFAIEGVEVGETVVRARARALWLKYEAALLAK